MSGFPALKTLDRPLHYCSVNVRDLEDMQKLITYSTDYLQKYQKESQKSCLNNYHVVEQWEFHIQIQFSMRQCTKIAGDFIPLYGGKLRCLENVPNILQLLQMFSKAKLLKSRCRNHTRELFIKH